MTLLGVLSKLSTSKQGSLLRLQFIPPFVVTVVAIAGVTLLCFAVVVAIAGVTLLCFAVVVVVGGGGGDSFVFLLFLS